MTMTMKSHAEQQQWTAIDEAQRLALTGYHDANVYQTVIGLLSEIEQLNRLSKKPYTSQYKKLIEESAKSWPEWYNGEWGATDEAKRLSVTYFDSNIRETFKELLSEINYLIQITKNAYIKLNDLPEGQLFKLPDDERRFIKGKRHYYKEKVTTRFIIYQVDLAGNVIDTRDLSLQRKVLPIYRSK